MSRSSSHNLWEWRCSLSIRTTRPIQGVIRINSLFVFMLRRIPLNGGTRVCLTICLLKDILVVSMFLLLQIKLLWTFVSQFLCESKCSFLWGKYQKCDCKGPMIKCMLHFIWNCQKILWSSRTILHSHSQCMRDSFPTFFPLL